MNELAIRFLSALQEEYEILCERGIKNRKQLASNSKKLEGSVNYSSADNKDTYQTVSIISSVFLGCLLVPEN